MEEKKNKLPIFFRKLVIPLLIISCSGYCYYIFVVNANFKKVVPGKVYRSAQPTDKQIRRFINRYDINTVINLRAKKLKDYQKEMNTTQELGAKFIPLDLSGNRLITPSELSDLIDALETAKPPLLIHCQSGVDRGGFTSALAAMAIGNENYNEAKRQAYVPPGPRKRKDFSKTRGYVYNYAHISDTLKLYEEYCRQSNLDTAGWEQFVEWTKILPPTEELDLDYYEPAYSYLPFLSKDKEFIPFEMLFKKTYVQFSIMILIVILITLCKVKAETRKK